KKASVGVTQLFSSRRSKRTTASPRLVEKSAGTSVNGIASSSAANQPVGRAHAGIRSTESTNPANPTCLTNDRREVIGSSDLKATATSGTRIVRPNEGRDGQEGQDGRGQEGLKTRR